MRGRRAFIVHHDPRRSSSPVFAWMLKRLSEESIRRDGVGFGEPGELRLGEIGRAIFLGLMMLQTLMVAVLAPAATAGAISSEREHQTLDLLAVTPISSLAIVLGKLLSALAWVFVLILASIPVTALVFVFGGVAPDDVIRGYVVLFATVIGLGSVGHLLLRAHAADRRLDRPDVRGHPRARRRHALPVDLLQQHGRGRADRPRRQPSEAILYLNPFVAQADVACGTEDAAFGGRVQLHLGHPRPASRPGRPIRASPTARAGRRRRAVAASASREDGVKPQNVDHRQSNPRPGGVGNGVEQLQVAQVTEPWRDRFWPKSVLSFLVLAAVMTFGVRPVRHPNAPLASQPAGSRAPPHPKEEHLMARPRPASPRGRRRPATVRGRASRWPVRPGRPAHGAGHRPLDADLVAIRRLLAPHGRRLWFRRIVRRAWLVLAAAVVAELVLWTLARVVPLEIAPTIAAAIPVVAGLALLVLAVVSRPSLGETAIAVDREGGLGDRAASALALAVAFPDTAGVQPVAEAGEGAAAIEAGDVTFDPEEERREFVRRQRRDTVTALRTTPANLFRPRFSRRPAAIALVAMLVLAPVVLLPNPQDAAIAAAQAVREEAKAQAERSIASPRSSRRRAPTPRIRAPGSPRSSASWRASCARTRTSSTPTSPSSAPSRPPSGRSSIRRTSSAPPRSPR